MVAAGADEALCDFSAAGVSTVNYFIKEGKTIKRLVLLGEGK